MTFKNKIIFFSSIFVSLLLIIIFVVLPLNKKNLQLSQEITNKQNEIKKNQISTEQIIKDSQNYKNINQDNLKNIFLDHQDVLSFINTIESTADNNNCLITINLPESSNNTQYEELDLNIQLQGSLPDFLNFMNDLEKQSFYINYSQISLSHNQSGVNIAPNITDNLIMNISAKTFWQ